MGFFDRFRKKAADTVDQQGDKMGAGIDKAADVADDKTGGKYTEKIDQGADAAKSGLDSLDGKNDDIADSPTGSPASSSGGTAQP